MANPELHSKPSHLADAAHVQERIYAEMSAADKLKEAVRLRQLAWAMKKAYLASQHPDLSEAELECQLRRVFLYATT